MFQLQKKSLLNQQGGCKPFVLKNEWMKCKKQKFKQNTENNQKQYYQWLRQIQIQSLQQNLILAQLQKSCLVQQFEEVVINHKLTQKDEVLKKYEASILNVNKQKSSKLVFEAQYTIDGKKQNSNQFCKICCKNKAQYCVNTCGHVCLCQKHLQLTHCPICQSQGKVIKINLPVKTGK